jgi:hypothetical protein
MAQYVKDDGIYVKNYFNTFGRVDDTALQLINCCRYVHRDKQGEYTKMAKSYDSAGNVTFEKVYKN